MNTIVIKPSIKNKYLEVHFNLWNSEKNNLKFLDIGIMCDNKDQTITLKMPSNNEVNVIDLFDVLKGDIRNSVFNCYVDKQTKNSFEVLTKTDDKKEFLLSPVKEKVSYDSEVKEAIIKLDIKEIKENDIGMSVERKYQRFRIVDFDKDKFVITQDSDSRFFESSYMSNTIIDFRFNDYRLLKTKEIQDLKLEDDNYTKIHFFYMTDALENVSVSSKNIKVRFLERALWNDYLKVDERKKDILVYHMVSENKSNSSFLLKFQQQKTSIKHLLFYAYMVICLAFFANILFSILHLHFKINSFVVSWAWVEIPLLFIPFLVLLINMIKNVFSDKKKK